MSWLISWFVLAIGVWVTALVLPGFKLRPGIGNAVMVAALFGVLNATIGALMYFMAGIVTLSLAWWLFATLTKAVISGVVLIIVDKMSDALEIESLPWAFIAGLMMNIIGAVGVRLLT